MELWTNVCHEELQARISSAEAVFVFSGVWWVSGNGKLSWIPWGVPEGVTIWAQYLLKGSSLNSRASERKIELLENSCGKEGGRRGCGVRPHEPRGRLSFLPPGGIIT